MLKGLPAIALVLLPACNSHKLEYCEAGTHTRFTIDFSQGTLAFGSEGISDELFPIRGCAERIETCFLGEVSFVQPFEADVGMNRNVVSVRRTGDGGFVIATRGGGTRATYRISRGDRFPREWRIASLNSQAATLFTRCGFFQQF
jgi:hypothetical protein